MKAGIEKILIATSNRGKMKEILAVLPRGGPVYLSLADIDSDPIDPVEDGSTLEENAVKKAREYSAHYQLPVIAEDSGLFVDALNGAPGVYSARFSGVSGPEQDKANNELLLEKLSGVPEEERRARFIAHMVLVSGKDVLISVEGRVEGQITERPIGDDGFGYDPIFWYPSFGKTFAQIPLEKKNTISHRRRALEKLSSRLTSIEV